MTRTYFTSRNNHRGIEVTEHESYHDERNIEATARLLDTLEMGSRAAKEMAR